MEVRAEGQSLPQLTVRNADERQESITLRARHTLTVGVRHRKGLDTLEAMML